MDSKTGHQDYWRRLEAVAAEHGPVIARTLRLRPGYLEPDELAIVLNYALGADLEQAHRDAPPLSAERVLESLATLSPEARHPRTAVDALAWYDRGASQGRKVPDVIRQGPLFQPAIETAFRGRRRERTEHSMRKLIDNNRELARAVDALVDALGEPGGSRASRAALRRSFKRIQSLLRSSEWHARAAAAWAVKNGFAMDGIGQAVYRLLLQPLRRLHRLMAELEEHLAVPEGERCSPLAQRTCHRILLELMDAAAEEWERDRPACNPASRITR